MNISKPLQSYLQFDYIVKKSSKYICRNWKLKVGLHINSNTCQKNRPNIFVETGNWKWDYISTQIPFQTEEAFTDSQQGFHLVL